MENKDIPLENRTLHKAPHMAALVYTAFIAGLCSIIYELLIATTASYFLGDSVKYFSLTIGIYMASMGIGSFVSKYIDDELLYKFIIIEIVLGFFGGLCIPVLYFAYAFANSFILFYILFTVIIGFLIGLEIPFLTRLMQNYDQLKFNIANILSFDYLGAFVATLSFPFFLLPFFGVYQSSLIFGLINMSIGFVILRVFSNDIGKGTAKLKAITIVLTTCLVGVIIFSSVALKHWDQRLYDDRVIYSDQSSYQRIVLTKHKDDIRLFLNGNLQFSSVDEHRYHESLIGVPLALHDKVVRKVLLLGAGDGIAIRELLKYPTIEEITLIDLDEKIIQLAKDNPHLKEINKDSLRSPKVHVIISDAFSYLAQNTILFDFIIADLPDPNNNALVRLYSKQFYQLVRNNLSENGVFVTQATSPYFATNAFWSIKKTVAASGFDYIYPYHTEVPSFGNWGFILASSRKYDINHSRVTVETRFLDETNFSSLFVFEKDIQEGDVSINTLDRPVLLNYYLSGWKHYSR